MHKLSERGVIHLLVPLILIFGLIAGVFLVTSGNPLKYFSKAGGGPIWFTDINGNTLPVNSSYIPQTTSPTVKIRFFSTLGPPASLTSSPKVQGGGVSGPITRTTKSFRFAENPTDLSSMPYTVYSSEPTVVTYTFKDSTVGSKFIWVDFLGSDGKTDRRSAQIEIVKTSVSGPISSPKPGIPEMVYPQNGQTLDLEGAYMFKVRPVAGATGYLFGLFQNNVMIYENLRDTKKLSPNGEFALRESDPFHNKFKAGSVKVMVRAMVGGKWTDAREITVTLRPRVVDTPKFGQSIKLDGTNGYADVNTTKFAVGNPYTVEAWVKLKKPLAGSNLYPGYDILTYTKIQSPYDYGYLFKLSTDYLDDRDWNKNYRWSFNTLLSNWTDRMNIHLSSIAVGANVTSTPEFDKWHHFAVTSYSEGDKCYLKSFVDGVLYGAGERVKTSCQISTNNPQQLLIGKPSSGTNTMYLNGEIDEVRISRGVRYTNNFPKPIVPFANDTNTLGLYHFDGNANDASGNGNNGQIKGSVQFVDSTVGSVANAVVQTQPTEKLTIGGLMTVFGSKRGDSRYNPSYDADQNGLINIRDFSLLRGKKLL